MKLYRKIDLYYLGNYLCSTNQSRTCKEAIQRYMDSPLMQPRFRGLIQKQIAKNPKSLKAKYSKEN